MATIQADPDDLDGHGRVFEGHAADMSDVHDYLHAILAGDVGMRGEDATSRSYRDNYLAQVRSLADSIGGAREGVTGISQGMRKMASDYRATDEAATKAVTTLTFADNTGGDNSGGNTTGGDSSGSDTTGGAIEAGPRMYAGVEQNQGAEEDQGIEPEAGNAAGPRIYYGKTQDQGIEPEPDNAASPRIYYGKTQDQGIEPEPGNAASPRIYYGKTQDQGIEPEAGSAAGPRIYYGKTQDQGIEPEPGTFVAPRTYDGVSASSYTDTIPAQPADSFQRIPAEAPRIYYGKTPDQGIEPEPGTFVAPRIYAGASESPRLEAVPAENTPRLIDQSAPLMESGYRDTEQAPLQDMTTPAIPTTPQSGS